MIRLPFLEPDRELASLEVSGSGGGGGGGGGGRSIDADREGTSGGGGSMAVRSSTTSSMFFPEGRGFDGATWSSSCPVFLMISTGFSFLIKGLSGSATLGDNTAFNASSLFDSVSGGDVEREDRFDRKSGVGTGTVMGTALLLEARILRLRRNAGRGRRGRFRSLFGRLGGFWRGRGRGILLVLINIYILVLNLVLFLFVRLRFLEELL